MEALDLHQDRHHSVKSIPVPAPCAVCGGFIFEAIRPPLR
jgi:hypothetical protein